MGHAEAKVYCPSFAAIMRNKVGGATYVAEALAEHGCKRTPHTLNKWAREGVPAKWLPEVAYALGVTVETLKRVEPPEREEWNIGTPDELATLYKELPRSDQAALWRVALALASTPASGPLEAMERKRTGLEGPTADEVIADLEWVSA